MIIETRHRVKVFLPVFFQRAPPGSHEFSHSESAGDQSETFPEKGAVVA
jgi:hypothetical protein